MKWSWKLGEIAHIEVRVHATFALLLVWLGVRAWSQDPTVASVVTGLAFVLALFACIVLHELGHALTARRFGIRTRDITLLPIGGVARLERMPDDPVQEWLVAMAGPTVTAAVAGLFWGGLWLSGAVPSLAPEHVAEMSFAERLMWVNVALLVFNLLPAFPMDGGRALRAILATRLSRLQATRIAAGLGQAMALGFGALGLFVNPFLVLIALFVWIGAAAEVSMVETRSALDGLSLRDAMLTDFEVLSPRDPLRRAVELTLAGSQKDFPVLDGDALAGVLGQEALVRGLSETGPDAPVGSAMAPSPAPLDARTPLVRILEQLDGSTRLLPVVEAGRFVGIVTADNVFELMRFRSALEERRSHPDRPLPQPVG